MIAQRDATSKNPMYSVSNEANYSRYEMINPITAEQRAQDEYQSDKITEQLNQLDTIEPGRHIRTQ